MYFSIKSFAIATLLASQALSQPIGDISERDTSVLEARSSGSTCVSQVQSVASSLQGSCGSPLGSISSSLNSLASLVNSLLGTQILATVNTNLGQLASATSSASGNLGGVLSNTGVSLDPTDASNLAAAINAFVSTANQLKSASANVKASTLYTALGGAAPINANVNLMVSNMNGMRSELHRWSGSATLVDVNGQTSGVVNSNVGVSAALTNFDNCMNGW